MNPSTSEKIKADSTRSGVMRKLNASSLNVLKFIVPVAIPLTGNASRHPTTPPIRASIIDSITKLVITAAFVGYLVAGLLGGTAAAAAVFAPPFLIVIAAAPYYRRFAGNPQVKAFVQGVTLTGVKG